MFRIACRSRWPAVRLAVLGLALSGCASSAPTPAPAPAPAPPPLTASKRPAPVRPRPVQPRPQQVQPRPQQVQPRPKMDSTAVEFAITAKLAHRPLARALARRTRKPEVAERVAWALVREAGRHRVSPSLLAAVLLIENRPMDSSAVSSQGAIGLMQVMPIHAGGYGCGTADLRTVDGNICHGARLLHNYIRRTRSVQIALRRYNGCVRGTNTPGCSRYPTRVLLTAARLRREMLASAADAGVIIPKT